MPVSLFRPANRRTRSPLKDGMVVKEHSDREVLTYITKGRAFTALKPTSTTQPSSRLDLQQSDLRS